LGVGEDKCAVAVVASGAEGAIGRAVQRRRGWLFWEYPFEGAELPAAAVVDVDENRGLVDLESLDGRVEKVDAHVEVGGVPGRLSAMAVFDMPWDMR